MNIEEAAVQFEALGNPKRLEIYRLLVRAGAEGMSVGSVQAEVGSVASTLSHHIKRLMAAGLVTQERHATTLICKADDEAMTALVAFLVDEYRNSVAFESHRKQRRAIRSDP